jgi:hypothetical protein
LLFRFSEKSRDNSLSLMKGKTKELYEEKSIHATVLAPNNSLPDCSWKWFRVSTSLLHDATVGAQVSMDSISQ